MLMQAMLLVCSLNAPECTPQTANAFAAGPVVGSLQLCRFQETVLRAQNNPSQGQQIATLCVGVSLASAYTETVSPLVMAVGMSPEFAVTQ
jgi:hypothetical protein